MRYWPVPSVTAVRAFSIRTGLDTSTETPGRTAPELSLTTPVMDLLSGCQRGHAPDGSQNDENSVDSAHTLSLVRVLPATAQILWCEVPKVNVFTSTLLIAWYCRGERTVWQLTSRARRRELPYCAQAAGRESAARRHRCVFRGRLDYAAMGDERRCLSRIPRQLDAQLLRMECRELRMGRRHRSEHSLASHRGRARRRSSESHRDHGRHEQRAQCRMTASTRRSSSPWQMACGRFST